MILSKKEKELDRVFSLFIRLRYASHEGNVTCYTCENIIHWSASQCGHFNLRANDSTRFSEDNCRVQCQECNMQKNGMPESFEEHLREEIGDEGFDELVKLGRDIKRLTEDEYDQKIKYYRLKVVELGGTI